MASQSSEFLAILSSSSSSTPNTNPKKSPFLPKQPANQQRESKLDLGNFETDYPFFPNNPPPSSVPPSPSYLQSQQPKLEDQQQDNFGLEGLVHVVRSSAALAASQGGVDLPKGENAIFSLGSDLASLGFDLNSTDFLYTKFASPWIEGGRGSAESFLPACYCVPQSAAGLLAKIPLVGDETLFYVFYGMPRDKGQLQAAHELFNRGWRYHRGLKLWFSRDPAATQQSAFFNSSTSSAAAGDASSRQLLSPDYSEKGTFVFFDFSSWQRIVKEFVVQASMVETKAPSPEKA